MQFILTRDVDRFSGRAGRLICSRLECNILATVLMDVRDGRYDQSPSLFAYAVEAGGDVVWAGLRTPPWPLIAAALDPPATAGGLIGPWLEEDPELPGVNAEPGTAAALAREWRSRTGGTTRRRTSMAMHVVERVVDPPRPSPGALRVAQTTERPLLLSWWAAFAQEAGMVGGGHRAALDSRLAHGRLLVWDHHGPVSMVGINRPVAGAVRVGPVYTPPALRGRGYGGTAVAEASRRALAGGARSCMLYTDLANPTSNKIYAEVGYRRAGDWEEHDFDRVESAGA